MKKTKENLFTITIMSGQYGTKVNHIMELKQIDINLCIFIIQWMYGNYMI